MVIGQIKSLNKLVPPHKVRCEHDLVLLFVSSFIDVYKVGLIFQMIIFRGKFFYQMN